MSKILIIDDDLENRDILRKRLELAGHQVEEAANGEEGLSLALGILPDLILLDVMMPKVNGWDVCRQIKSHPKIGTVPVLMLTSCDQQIDKLRGWESGADEYVTKPWDPIKLIELIQKWCATSP